MAELQVLLLRETWSGYVVLARGTRGRPSPRAKWGQVPPRKDSKMQRKRTGPGAPRAGPSPRKREIVDV